MHTSSATPLGKELHKFRGCHHLRLWAECGSSLLHVMAPGSAYWSGLCVVDPVITLPRIVESPKVFGINGPNLACKSLQWCPVFLRVYFKMLFTVLSQRSFHAFWLVLFSVFHNPAFHPSGLSRVISIWKPYNTLEFAAYAVISRLCQQEDSLWVIFD